MMLKKMYITEVRNLLNKKFILLISAFAFAAFITVGLILIFQNDKIVLKKNTDHIFANKTSVMFFKIEYKNKLKQHFSPFKGKFEVEVTKGKKLVQKIKSDTGFFIKAGFQEGIVHVKVTGDFQVMEDEIKILPDANDSDGDGIPDVAELTTIDDRENFCGWFSAVAESQFYIKSESWEEINQNCSGLVVFAFKEALKKHDNVWLKKNKFAAKRNIADITKYNYPEVPLLGENIFRTAKGTFQIGDLSNDKFSKTANVNNLLNFNLTFAGKDKSVIKKGDVIFYNTFDNSEMPYHSMIYIGDGDYLIYHTGPLPGNKLGEVRKVTFDNLMKHPDSRWHPTKDNPNYLGIYRWNILM
jgi:uncharacterized protein